MLLFKIKTSTTPLSTLERKTSYKNRAFLGETVFRSNSYDDSPFYDTPYRASSVSDVSPRTGFRRAEERLHRTEFDSTERHELGRQRSHDSTLPNNEVPVSPRTHSSTSSDYVLYFGTRRASANDLQTYPSFDRNDINELYKQIRK